MKQYTLVIAYDGTGYHGWQEQRDCVTVSMTLRDTFRRVFGTDVGLVGASRTDAGVHALGQVARATVPLKLAIDAATLKRAWNASLPPDIHIRSLTPSLPHFHPHWRVIDKLYQYHVFIKRPLPMFARYGYHYTYAWSLEKCTESLQHFVGTHDFWSFCTEELPEVNTICSIKRAFVEPLPHLKAIRISFVGDRFLYHMVRRMVGAALTIASFENRSVAEIPRALQERSSRRLFVTAPPQGLVLRKIRYDQSIIF
ncbi:MAG: tRNA pseudouridine synthase A [candidate division TM6 bacterium GW2011_GWE2_42_60]|nr:MAG: tRNA pseudouridine synthase A [candidate division TM6 bacterium GW2011_GWE2_42_60]HBY05736.1 tRNA pseudouridine(38-40) synthase TruA [Candidatus Dependentiae bacterium]